MADDEDSMLAAVDALLAQSSSLPSPAERARLRRAAGVTQQQVAAALELRRAETISEWENGAAAPRGKRREMYARLLEGWAAMYPAAEETAPTPAPPARLRRHKPLPLREIVRSEIQS